jgi:drug/metabolite transporter (DMT)-like permease
MGSVRFHALLLLAVVLEGTADLLFRKWGIARQNGAAPWLFFILSLGIYTAGATCWGLSLQYQAVSRAIVGFLVLNVLMVVFAGVWLYGEHLSTTNRVGIVLGVCSLILVEWE